jgi:hypothetical protein
MIYEICGIEPSLCFQQNLQFICLYYNGGVSKNNNGLKRYLKKKTHGRKQNKNWNIKWSNKRIKIRIERIKKVKVYYL